MGGAGTVTLYTIPIVRAKAGIHPDAVTAQQSRDPDKGVTSEPRVQAQGGVSKQEKGRGCAESKPGRARRYEQHGVAKSLVPPEWAVQAGSTGKGARGSTEGQIKEQLPCQVTSWA